MRSPFTLAVMLVLSIASLPCYGADDRLPVPGAAELAKAEALVKGLFKSEFAKTKASDRLALAQTLLQNAAETKDDSAARFVLLREARDLAARAGDGALAMRTADELARTFAVGPGEVRAAVADMIADRAYSVTEAQTAADILITAGDLARAAEDWDSAAKLYKAAEAAARKARSIPLLTRSQSLIKQAAAIKVEGEKLKEHLATLKEKPKDPAANLAAGRFFCFFKGDWVNGAIMLSRGADDALRLAAQKDLKAFDGAFEDQVAAGDGWYDLIATADPVVKSAIQSRAYHWYETAVPRATGLVKVKAEKRMLELQVFAGPRSDHARLLNGVRQAIEDKLTKKWEIIGGAFSRDTYEELAPGGGILIGFYYTTINEGRHPGVVQPIYLTASGEAKGKMFGMLAPGAKLEVVKAKPGYAVGAIYTRGGGGIDAIQPIFMKMTDRGLDIHDSYNGPRIGGDGGGEATLGGDGNFIVGLHGRISREGNLAAVSPITLTVVEAKKK